MITFISSFHCSTIATVIYKMGVTYCTSNLFNRRHTGLCYLIPYSGKSFCKFWKSENILFGIITLLYPGFLYFQNIVSFAFRYTVVYQKNCITKVWIGLTISRTKCIISPVLKHKTSVHELTRKLSRNWSSWILHNQLSVKVNLKMKNILSTCLVDI